MTSPPPSATPPPAVPPVPRAFVGVIPRYAPGRQAEDVIAEHGVATAVKLSSNEGPFGPLPGVVEAVAQSAAGAGRYPDHVAGRLRAALAQRHGIGPSAIGVGPGSVGLLQQLFLAFCGPGDEVLYPWPSFIAYPQFAALSGAAPVTPALDRWTIDVDAVIAAMSERTRVVVIANPNNPTSTALGADAIDRLVAAVPSDVLLVLDEAYHEYVTDPSVPDGIDRYVRPDTYPNVAVLRTFSKAYGLAGLRVGYVAAHPQVVDAIDAALIPFGVNLAAQHAALAALEHAGPSGEVARRAALVVAERARVTDAVRAHGIDVPDSQANFVWLPMEGGDAARVAQRLETLGVVTRPMPGGIRVTIGLPEENDMFLRRLAQVLSPTPG